MRTPVEITTSCPAAGDDGHRVRSCTHCKRAYNLAYRTKHLEGLKAKNRAYYHATKERYSARTKEYRARNKEAISEANKAWNKANKPKQFEYDLRKKFGIMPEDYARLIHSQGLECAACGDTLAMDKKTHIDHCHATGKVRGIACHHCNTALGLVLESEHRLRALLRYVCGQSDLEVSP